VHATKLKAHLFEVYDGLADKRAKKLEKSHPFIVDDRDPQRPTRAFRRDCSGSLVRGPRSL
jgi:hypothetical protein